MASAAFETPSSLTPNGSAVDAVDITRGGAISWEKPMTDPVLTVDEVARELRCSKAHVYNTINGKVRGVSALPALRMGRRVLVRRSSLERWKAKSEVLENDMLWTSLEVVAGDPWRSQDA